MHVTHHRPGPTHIEIAFARTGTTGLALGDVALHRRLPETLVGRIDRVLTGVGGYRQLGGEYVLAILPTQCECLDALAGAQHELRRRAVQGVARCNLLASSLQETSVAKRPHRGLQHRKYGADRGVDVDVSGAIKGVEQSQILLVGSLRSLGQRQQVVHFFRRQSAQVSRG